MTLILVGSVVSILATDAGTSCNCAEFKPTKKKDKWTLLISCQFLNLNYIYRMVVWPLEVGHYKKLSMDWEVLLVVLRQSKQKKKEEAKDLWKMISTKIL